MTLALCPSHDELRDYLCGKLSDEASDAMAEHFESCSLCQAELANFPDSDDTLIARLKDPETPDPYAVEPKYEEALARAKSLFAACGADGKPSPVADASTTFFNRQLGEYQLIERLGRGGMGMVYKARQQRLDRVVALKILSHGRTGDAVAIVRFEREMKAIGRLDHPNIVQAYDAREIDGTLVLIMEFIDGLDLAEIVRRVGPLPAPEACELIRRTAIALQCAHEHGLVHRDIKPSNVMLSRSGEVKLLDLGLARFFAESALPCATGVSPVPPYGSCATGSASASSGAAGVSPVLPADEPPEEMTVTGQAMGTADYMAPEQASDSRTVDIRADIYSLGCTLYKLLCGRAPFGGPEHRATLDKMNAHVRETPPPIRQFVPDLPEELAAIVDRMLAKNPADRFSTPAEVAAALEKVAEASSLSTNVEQVSNLSKDAGQVGNPSHEPNLPELITRAIALPREQWAKAEKSQDANFITPRPTTLPIRRRPIVRNLLLGAAFFGLLALGFAGGIIITINREGKPPTTAEVPEGSKFEINKRGDLKIDLPPGEDGEYELIDLTGKKHSAALPPEPYKIAPGDYLLIRAAFTLPDQPIDGIYRVEPRGTVPLPPAYGRAKIDGLSMVEAEAAIVKTLSELLRNPEVSVTLAGWKKRTPGAPPPEPHRIAPGDILNIQASFCLPDQPIHGPYLVESDGQVTLGPTYGRVNLKGLTFEEAEKVAHEKLAEVLRQPDVSITLEGWRKPVKWQDIEKPAEPKKAESQTKAEPKTPPTEAQIKVFSIAYGDAESLGRGIQQILPTDDAAALAEAMGKEKLTHPLKLSVDSRTNSLIASGDPDALAAVEALLKRLDVQRSKTAEKVSFRTTKITRGDISSVVTATGTIEPEEVIDVSPQVSGQIVKLFVDYNSHVEKDQALAEIDNQVYKSRLTQEQAARERAKAEVMQAEAKLASARAELETTTEANKRVPNSVPASELRTLAGNQQAAMAALSAAKANLSQAESAVELANRNLEKTMIYSPIKGVVIKRSVNLGQNVSPDAKNGSLFMVAHDFEKMQIRTYVEQSVVGRIREGMDVTFSVDVFPKEVFKAKVKQIRLPESGAICPVILTFDNPERKLLPYTNTNVKFEIETHRNVLLAPNAALRWKPDNGQIGLALAPEPGAGDRVRSSIPLWKKTENGMLVLPINAVQLGITDGNKTEVSGPEIKEGMEVVVGDNPTADLTDSLPKPVDPFEWHAIVPPPGTNPNQVPAVNPAAEFKAMQGTWRVVALEKGKESKAPDARIVKINERMFETVGPKWLDHRQQAYTIDPAKTPKTIDLSTLMWPPQSREKQWLGVYGFEGDQLKICLTKWIAALATEQRPTGFQVDPNSADALYVLQRNEPSDDEKRLEGDWDVVARTDEGKQASNDPERISRFRFTQQHEAVSWHGSDFNMPSEGYYVLDPKPAPPRMTILATEVEKFNDMYGPVKRTFEGIYKFQEDGRLLFAYRKDGAAPESFESAPGSGVTVLELKRTEAAPANAAEPAANSAPAQDDAANAAMTATPPSSRPLVNPAAEYKAMQGWWRVAKLEKGKDSQFPNVRVLSLDGRCLLAMGMEWSDYIHRPYTIDPTATPKAIDLCAPNSVGEAGEKKEWLGIYEFDGDHLKVCLSPYVRALANDQRPKAFTVDPNSADALLVLERETPSDDDKPLLGDWDVTSTIDDGQSVPLDFADEPAEYAKLRIAKFHFEKRNLIKWYGSQLTNATGGSFLVDTTQQPPRITMFAHEWRYENRVYRPGPSPLAGIYRINGDQLTIAYRDSGPAPEKFESTPGSGVTLLELKRGKPKSKDVVESPANNASPPAQQTEAAKPASTAVNPPQVYNGKTLDQWSNIAATELNANTQAEAFKAIVMFDGPGIDTFQKIIKEGGPQRKKTAIWTIENLRQEAQFGTPLREKVVRLLISLLENGDADLRYTAANNLNWYARESGPAGPSGKNINPLRQIIMPALLKAMDDQDERVRGEVLLVTGGAPFWEEWKVLGESIVLAEINALDDKSPDNRRYALFNLHSFGPKAERAVPKLIELVQRLCSDPAVKNVKEFASNPVKRGDETDEKCHDLLRAVTVLGEIGPGAKAALPILDEIIAQIAADDKVIPGLKEPLKKAAEESWKKIRGEKVEPSEPSADAPMPANSPRGPEKARIAGKAHKSAYLGGWQVTDETMASLKDSPKLQSLCLANGNISDAGLVNVEGLTELESLDLTFTKITDAGLQHLRPLVKLRVLNLHGDNITDAGLEHLKGLTELENLDLTFTKITDAGLERLKGFPKLKALGLVGTPQITDAGLAHLQGLPELEAIDLRWSHQITDAGLANLKGLPKLNWLVLWGTQISDAGLENLRTLLQLKTLELGRTKVTDAGLPKLERLKNLQSVGFGETPVTSEAKEKLRKALPNCKVD